MKFNCPHGERFRRQRASVVTFFKQGHSSKNLEWVLAIWCCDRVGRGRSDRYYRDRESCFHVSLFPVFLADQFFVLLFVLRQYVMLFCNKTKKVHFLYISFFFSFTYVVMGKSLCRVHVYMSGAHQLTYIPVTAFSQTDYYYFWFEFISNSDSHRNLIHK